MVIHVELNVNSTSNGRRTDSLTEEIALVHSGRILQNYLTLPRDAMNEAAFLEPDAHRRSRDLESPGKRLDLRPTGERQPPCRAPDSFLGHQQDCGVVVNGASSQRGVLTRSLACSIRFL